MPSVIRNFEIVTGENEERHGVMTLTNTKGEVSKYLYDEEDDKLMKKYAWSNQRGYLRAKIDNKYIPLHRLLMKCNDINACVDHINNNPSDDRKANLRITSASNNMQNKMKILSDTSSKYIGVSWNKDNKIWRMTIRNGGKQESAQYKDEVHAAFAYDLAAIRIYGENAKTNKSAFNIQKPADFVLYKPVNKNEFRIRNIFKCRNKFRVIFTISGKKTDKSGFSTVEEAILYRDTIFNQLNSVQAQNILKEPIQRITGVAVIPVYNKTNQFIQVDDEDYYRVIRLGNVTMNKKGWIKIKDQLLSRILMMDKIDTSGLVKPQVIFIDGNHLNLRKTNLRVVSPSESKYNTIKHNGEYLGVHPSRCKWNATI